MDLEPLGETKTSQCYTQILVRDNSVLDSALRFGGPANPFFSETANTQIQGQSFMVSNLAQPHYQQPKFYPSFMANASLSIPNPPIMLANPHTLVDPSTLTKDGLDLADDDEDEYKEESDGLSEEGEEEMEDETLPPLVDEPDIAIETDLEHYKKVRQQLANPK